MKKGCIVLMSAVALIASVASVDRASAQIPGLGIRLVPKIGMHRSLSDLAEGMRMEDKLAIGAAAELRLPIIPIGLRANVDYSGSADIMMESGVRDAAPIRAGSASLLNIVGDVILHPIPGIIPVQPYLFAGGGVKKYKFRDFSSATLNSGNNRSDPTLHLGAGVELKLGVMGLLVEAGDYVSRFENAGSSKLQNDGYGMLGFRVGIL